MSESMSLSVAVDTAAAEEAKQAIEGLGPPSGAKIVDAVNSAIADGARLSQR